MVKELRLKRISIYYGASLGLFGLGFGISKYNADITIGFLWASIEW